MYPHRAQRQDRYRGHVAVVVVPYVPQDVLGPLAIRMREHHPWMCCMHLGDGVPLHFIAFGGREGMDSFLDHELGPRVPASPQTFRAARAKGAADVGQ